MRMLQVIDPYGADPRMRLGIEMAVDFIFAEFSFVYFHCFLSWGKKVWQYKTEFVYTEQLYKFVFSRLTGEKVLYILTPTY